MTIPQRIHIDDAIIHLKQMKKQLEDMGGQDKSGYLPYQITYFEESIAQFRKQQIEKSKF